MKKKEIFQQSAANIDARIDFCMRFLEKWQNLFCAPKIIRKFCVAARKKINDTNKTQVRYIFRERKIPFFITGHNGFCRVFTIVLKNSCSLFD